MKNGSGEGNPKTITLIVLYVLERISRKLPQIIVKLQVESIDISKRQSY